jgi:hypothetical protein
MAAGFIGQLEQWAGQRDCKACRSFVAQECWISPLQCGRHGQPAAAASFHDPIISSLALGFVAKSCHNRPRQVVGDGLCLAPGAAESIAKHEGQPNGGDRCLHQQWVRGCSHAPLAGLKRPRKAVIP